MTEEQHTEVIEQKCNCFCQSKWFKKVLVTALGTFIGVYCALSLFTVLHRPPMPPCSMKYHMGMPHYGHHQMYREFKKDFHKNMLSPNYDKNFSPRPEKADK